MVRDYIFYERNNNQNDTLQYYIFPGCIFITQSNSENTSKTHVGFATQVDDGSHYGMASTGVAYGGGVDFRTYHNYIELIYGRQRYRLCVQITGVHFA